MMKLTKLSTKFQICFVVLILAISSINASCMRKTKVKVEKRPNRDTSITTTTTTTPNNTPNNTSNTSSTTSSSSTTTNNSSTEEGGLTINPPSSAPSMKAFTNVAQTSVTLNWTDISDESGYKIERALYNGSACGEFSQITTLAQNITSYDDSGLSANTTYCYKVRGYNAGGNGPYSSVAQVTTLPNPPSEAPSMQAFTNVVQTSVTLNWTDISDESGYKIERALYNGSACEEFSQIATLAQNITSYDDSGLSANTTYCYKVRGYNAGGNGPYSSSNSIRTASTVVISNYPQGTNNITNLNIDVLNDYDIVSYKYKIGISIDCSSPIGYSVEISQNVKITDDISGLADDTIVLCVIGKNIGNTWQPYSSATSATWTKDTTPPTVQLSDVPSGTNNTTSLNIDVLNNDVVVSYKYKIGEASSVDCSNSSSYSSEINESTNITDNISALPDGNIKLCVIGKDSAGNWQPYSSATSATWTKDTTPPTVQLSGVPSGTNNTTSLNIDVLNNDGVVSYKYKIGEASSVDCFNSSSYSSEINESTNITDNISALPDGNIKLCVIGKDSVGNWQPYSSATSATWTKDTTPPNTPSSFIATAGDTVVNLSWGSGGGDLSGYIVVRKTGSAVSWTPTNGNTYSLGDLGAGNIAIYIGSSTTYQDSGLTNGTTYYYAIFAYDNVYNYSSSATTNATPQASSSFAMYVGGLFTTIGGTAASKIAKWNGTSWSSLAIGTQNSVFAIGIKNSTNIYVGGSFSSAGGIPNTRSIAKWNGTNWEALGTGIQGTITFVYAIGILNTDVYIVGSFNTVNNSVGYKNIARWNGSSWYTVGGGFDSSVKAIAVDTINNYVYAWGGFTSPGAYIVRWNGNAWSTLGGATLDGIVNSIAISGSNVYVGGEFYTPGSKIARWNGSSWYTLGSGIDSYVYAIAISGTDVYVGGYFYNADGVSANNIARWNGSQWYALGSGTSFYVYTIAISGTDVYAGGENSPYLSKWNGSSWSTIGYVNDNIKVIQISN